MVNVQVLTHLQAPDQPAKKAPLAGAAVSFTLVPELNDAVQVGLQLMPAGLLVTVPVDVPANFTVRAKVVGGAEVGAVSWAAKPRPQTRVAIRTAVRTRWQVKEFDLRG